MTALSLPVQTALLALFLAVVGFILFKPTRLVKWLQKKNYQYEVTFSLYMLTPTEKFIFNSILFLTLSMFMLACTLYLPNHVATMGRRAFYYFAGETVVGSEAGWVAAKSVSEISEVVKEGTRAVMNQVAQATAEAASSAQEVVEQVKETVGCD